MAYNYMRPNLRPLIVGLASVVVLAVAAKSNSDAITEPLRPMFEFMNNSFFHIPSPSCEQVYFTINLMPSCVDNRA
jgi:hypothetical protein